MNARIARSLNVCAIDSTAAIYPLGHDDIPWSGSSDNDVLGLAQSTGRTRVVYRSTMSVHSSEYAPMDRIIRYTEQLQLVGAFLHETGKYYARLSLILCDNVIEMLAHERCTNYLLQEASWLSVPKLTAKDRDAARGQRFTPKIDLLLRLGDITQDERDFAAQAHALRNECYHAAATHSDIAWRIAWEYHEIACSLYERFGQSGMTVGGQVHQSHPTRELLEKAGFMGGDFPSDWTDTFNKLGSLLRATKPATSDTLGKVLSLAVQRRFSEMVSTVEFLAQDGLQTDDLDEAIREAYFCGTFDFDSLVTGIDTQTKLGFVEFHKRREAARTTFVSPLRYSRIKGWIKRSVSLATESSSTLAIVKYMDLRRESEEADMILNEMGQQLDKAIQLQVDIARGK